MRLRTNHGSIESFCLTFHLVMPSSSICHSIPPMASHHEAFAKDGYINLWKDAWTWNHSIWLERVFGGLIVQPPAQGRSPCTIPDKGVSNLFFKTPQLREVSCSIDCSFRNFLLGSKLNLRISLWWTSTCCFLSCTQVSRRINWPLPSLWRLSKY